MDAKQEDRFKERTERVKKTVQEQQQELLRIVRGLCETKSGIEFLKFLYKWCHMDTSLLNSQTGGMSASEIMFFGEGRRLLYLAIQQVLPVDARIKIEISKPNEENSEVSK